MKLDFCDEDEATLVALGTTYNYTITAEQRGQRVWKCEQTHYLPDGHVTLLKGAWAQDMVEAVRVCQAWEDASENAPDGTRRGRYNAAAAATRERRKALRERPK